MNSSHTTAINYRARTTFWLALATLILVPPFVLNHFLKNNLVPAITSGAIFLAVLTLVVCIRRGYYHSTLTILIVIPAVTSYLATSLYYQGVIGVFWSYPSLLALFFILPRRQAIVGSICMLAVLIPCIWQFLDPIIALRGAVSLITVTIFSAIFVLIIEKQQQELEEKEKTRLESMARATNELRQPLDEVLQRLEPALATEDPPSRQELLSLSDSVRKLQHLLEDLHLISLADIQEAKYDLQPVQWSRIIESASQATSEKLRKRRIHAYRDLDESIWVTADPQMLLQITNALLDNCFQHTEKGGDVHLRLSRGKDVAKFTITDTGPGVDESHLPHLFERFYRASGGQTDGSRGLGLALVRALIELQGGKARAFKAVEGGLGIQLILPCRTTPTDD